MNNYDINYIFRRNHMSIPPFLNEKSYYFAKISFSKKNHNILLKYHFSQKYFFSKSYFSAKNIKLHFSPKLKHVLSHQNRQIT